MPKASVRKDARPTDARAVRIPCAPAWPCAALPRRCRGAWQHDAMRALFRRHGNTTALSQRVLAFFQLHGTYASPPPGKGACEAEVREAQLEWMIQQESWAPPPAAARPGRWRRGSKG